MSVMMHPLNPETKVVSDTDALRLENYQLKLQFLQYQLDTLLAESQRVITEMAVRYEAEGWQLDLRNRCFVPPPEQEMRSNGHDHHQSESLQTGHR